MESSSVGKAFIAAACGIERLSAMGGFAYSCVKGPARQSAIQTAGLRLQAIQ
jgi:hypothetical protein